MENGLLISFEGIDGCGKSTQLGRLADRLRSIGIEPLLVREPGGTTVGERVRELLLDPATGDIDARAEALLYAASRAELVSQVIEPALLAGRVVLVDRYVDSSLAYQGAGRGIGIDRVLDANLLATGGRLPDRTILVELDPAVASARVAAAGAPPDRLESAGDAFFTRVHAAYGELAGRWPERIRPVDGAATVADIEERIHAELAPVFQGVGIDLPVPRHTSEELAR